MADENTPLKIEIDVDTEKAKKKLAEFNKALQKAASKGEQAELLQGFQEKLDRSVLYGHNKKGTAFDKYLKDVEKLQNAIDKLLPKTKERLNVPPETTLPEDFTDKQLKGFDKRVWDENKGTITQWTNTTEKGIKSVVKELQDANGETETLTTTLTKAKGTFVESGKLLGTQILRTDEADKTKIKTEEIANGFKKVREYVKLANSELYLMSTRTTKVDEKTEKLTKKQKIGNFFKNALGDLGKNATKSTKELRKIFGRMGSIVTYRIIRSMLSAITNAFKQGFNLLGSQNSTISAIQEQFTAITTSLQVSLTTILIPLFQTLSNVLAPLSQTFIDIANAISYTNAKASEQSTFFQLSKEKIDEYAKSLQKTNKQLSQLDKFATLSGSSSTPILGEMVEVSEASDKVIKDTEKYQKVIDFFEKVNGVITKVFDGAEKLFNFVSDNFELVIGLSYALLTALNPLASAIVSLGILMSDAAPAVKILAGTMLALSGALLAVGIAKEFTKNPYAGLVAAGIGATLAVGIGALVAGMSSVDNAVAKSGSSLNYSTTGYSSGSDLYSGIESATKNGYTSSGATRVSGDVYIDGVKAGKVLENSVYNEGVRVGHMGRK